MAGSSLSWWATRFTLAKKRIKCVAGKAGIRSRRSRPSASQESSLVRVLTVAPRKGGVREDLNEDLTEYKVKAILPYYKETLMKCQHCGKDFKEGKIYWKKYCSPRCSQSVYTQKWREKNRSQKA